MASQWDLELLVSTTTSMVANVSASPALVYKCVLFMWEGA